MEVLLEEKYVLEYIRYTLTSMMISTSSIFNARYHHNTEYILTKSIIKYGILSLEELNKLGLRSDPANMLELMDDIESHINGKNGVSLSVVGLTDLYRDEEEYNPYNSNFVDILVSSDVRAVRNSVHYGNEFVSREVITPDKIKSIDIRLLNFINSKKYENIEEVVNRYNSLKSIALTIINENLNIPVREMSDNTGNIFDVDRLATIHKVKLKS